MSWPPLDKTPKNSENPFLPCDAASAFGEGEEEEPSDNLPEGAEYCPDHLLRVLEKKDGILALHSSETRTQIFNCECEYCQRWFKPCMFSHNERKSGNMQCRWCQIDYGNAEANQFQIHWHIHCNKPGKKICGESRTMVPAVKKEVALADVAPQPEAVITNTGKMSQKQRKAAAREAPAGEAAAGEASSSKPSPPWGEPSSSKPSSPWGEPSSSSKPPPSWDHSGWD